MSDELSITQKEAIEACFEVGDGMMDDVWLNLEDALIGLAEATGGAIGIIGQAYTTLAECIITLGADCAGNVASLIDDIIETLATLAGVANSIDEAESALSTARAQYEECKALCAVFEEQNAVDESQEERLDEMEAQIEELRSQMEDLQEQLEDAQEALEDVE
jgi:DNA repair ATPase RecN